MWNQVRWGRLVPIVAVGLLVGNLSGGLALALSTGLGFLIGGLLFELWWRPRMQARIDRRLGDPDDPPDPV